MIRYTGKGARLIFSNWLPKCAQHTIKAACKRLTHVAFCRPAADIYGYGSNGPDSGPHMDGEYNGSGISKIGCLVASSMDIFCNLLHRLYCTIACSVAYENMCKIKWSILFSGLYFLNIRWSCNNN